MHKKKQVAVVVAGALLLLGLPISRGAQFDLTAGPVIAVGADPMLAVETSRGAIIDRLTADYAAARQAAGVGEDVFRATLAGLRADQLLAATLVGTFAELTAIVSQAASDEAPLTRYVAVTPTSVLATLPVADGYLVREGDSLSVVKASDLKLGANMQLVGYFVASGGMTVATSTGTGSTAKDGSGSGANSWIGYTGGNNVESGSGSAVAAGTYNTASNTNASVFAGQSNVAGGVSSLVIGGFDNQALAIDSLVGAGAGNRATGARSVVIGGGYNLASGQWSFVGGGGRQTSDAAGAGGFYQDNVASGDFSVVSGGQANIAGSFATVGGGFKNYAGGINSSVLGGFENIAGGYASAALGGIINTALGQASITVGGTGNHASGDYSLAAGTGAQADQNLCMVFSLWPANVGNPGLTCGGIPSVFKVGANNGFSVDYGVSNNYGFGQHWVLIGPTISGQTISTWTGAFLSDGGTWYNASDRNAKENFVAVDAKNLLAQVVALPITRWQYKKEPAVTHIGPMAQDFRAAFAVGQDERSISTVDEGGVALVAIQGLNAKLEERIAVQAARIAELERTYTFQTSQLDAQQREIAALRVAQDVQIAELRHTVKALLALSPNDGKLAAAR